MCSNVVVLSSFTKDFDDVDTTNILAVSMLYPRKALILMSDYNCLILMPKFVIECHNEVQSNWGSSIYDISIVFVEGTQQLAFNVNDSVCGKDAIYHRAAIFQTCYCKYRAVESLENLFCELGLRNGLN